ncbi:hypothetical protein Glove_208g153 [Diversispora epigaea]|uniref:Uncharacterized protein n=1 Tax=Diversispora epigaea TaxID=1348612 RepID=A0A397IJE0_9GLOM|nr:hypothetical protein Glove_208g153 [Diversispora epigaea]
MNEWINDNLLTFKILFTFYFLIFIYLSHHTNFLCPLFLTFSLSHFLTSSLPHFQNTVFITFGIILFIFDR